MPPGLQLRLCVMQKFSIAFLAAASLMSFGCKKGEDKAAGGDKDKMAPADKPVDKAGDKPAEKAADKAAATGANADIPAECNDYKAAMEKLAACDKMPQASKDALKQGYDAMSQGWAAAKDMPAEAKKAMADGCKQGADALMQSGKALCGW